MFMAGRLTLTPALSRRGRGGFQRRGPVAARVLAAVAVVAVLLAACGEGGPPAGTDAPDEPQAQGSVEYLGDEVQAELVRAVVDFDAAIELNPEDPSLYLQRGATLAELLELNKAVEDFSQAIRLDPTNAQAYMMRAEAYTRFGHLSLAIEDYTEAIELDTQNPAGFLGRAEAYRRLGQFPRATPARSSAVRGPRARRRWRTTRGC